MLLPSPRPGVSLELSTRSGGSKMDNKITSKSTSPTLNPTMKNYKILFGAVCAVILAFSQNAKADFMSTLSVGNEAIAGFPGPYGFVDVTLSGQTATITFTANTAGGFMFIDTSAAGVQVNSSSFTEAIVTDTQFKEFNFGKNVDGFGVFNLTVNNNDGSGSAVDTIVFTVTNAGTPWASPSDVLTTNSKGFDAVAHISVNGGVATGFAGEPGGGGGHVPDNGVTAALLGLGLVGLAGLRAKFGKN